MTELSGLDPEEDFGNLLSIPSSVNGLEEKNEPQLAMPASEGLCVMDVNIDSDSSGGADCFQECQGDPAEIQECLNTNQSLQKQLWDMFRNIQSSLDTNIAKQAQISEDLTKDREIFESEPKLTDNRSFRLFTCPYFRDAREMFPPNNEDTIEKTKNRDITAYIRPSKRWSDEEKTQLYNGVLASALEVVLKGKEIRRDFLRRKLSGCHLLGEKNKFRKEIKSISQTIADIKKKSPEYLLKEADGKIDWLKVSATHLKGSRGDDECEFMWNNFVSIFVNQNDFNEEEDAELKDLVKYLGMQDWDKIAELLGTQRSAIQCMERYQRELNEDLHKPFTVKEDEKILKFVERKKIGDYVPWNQLCIKGKSTEKVSKRFQAIKKSIYRGPFTKHEDAMLLACFAKYGSNWSTMEKYFFPNRLQHGLSLRHSLLDPSLKFGSWTKEEDHRLAELIVEYGYCWAKIATKMPGRSYRTCCLRIKYLVESIKKSDKSLKNENYKEDTSFLLKHLPGRRSGKRSWFENDSDTYKKLYDAALEILRKALCNISFPLAKDVQVDKINLPFPLLVKLRDELKRMEREDRTKTKPVWHPDIYRSFPSWKIIDRPSDNEGSSVVSSESEMEVEPESTPEVGLVVEEPEVDGAWLTQVLEAKFQEEYNMYDLHPVFISWNRGNVRDKKNLEFAFYQEYLRKELFLPPSYDLTLLSCAEELSMFNRSVDTVMRHFIQPKPREHEVIVLPPNHITLLGLEVMLAAQPRLQRTAQFVDRSTSYIEYLNGSKVQDLCCFACSSKNENSQEAYQNTIKEMKSELLFIDEDFDEAARCETGYWPEQEDACMCDSLLESKAQVDLLMKRFVALFFWPYFLSTVTPQANDELTALALKISDKFSTLEEQEQRREKKRRRKKNRSRRFIP